VDNYRVFGGKLYVLGENFLRFAGQKPMLAETCSCPQRDEAVLPFLLYARIPRFFHTLTTRQTEYLGTTGNPTAIGRGI